MQNLKLETKHLDAKKWKHPFLVGVSVRRLRAGSGMSLMEYGLVGVLGFGVCAGTMFMVGDQMEHLLSGLKQNMRHRVESGQELKTSLAASNVRQATEEIASNATLAVNPSNPDELCSKDGWCIKAPGMTGDTVYTTGSNGLQNLAESTADIYSRMAEILKKEAGSSELTDLLTEMSSEGYAVADLQRQLETSGGILQVGSYASITKQTMGDLQNKLSQFTSMNDKMESLIQSLPADKQGILKDASNVILAVGKSYSLQAYGYNPYDDTIISSGTAAGNTSGTDAGTSGSTDSAASYSYSTATDTSSSGTSISDTNMVAVNFTSIKVELTCAKAATLCENGGNQPQCSH